MCYNAVKINNLDFSYPDKKNVLDNIYLNVITGNSIGLVGGNGSGKTTLFYLISGILKPLKGSIFVFEKKVKLKTFNPDVGFVFQNPDDQLFSPTVYDDIAFGLLNMGLSEKDVYQRVMLTLEKANYKHLVNRPSQHLSGGEKRKISILATAVMEPKLMMLDEPTSNMDIKARRELINFLNSLSNTKIISSHDLEFILETCEKVILLNKARVEVFGYAKEILANKELMEKCNQEVPPSMKNGLL